MSHSDRLNETLSKKKKLLSIFFTAGYPNLNDTLSLLKMIEEEGVDFVELGFPYSDPLADGVVIQETSEVALANGMSLAVLFEQLAFLRPQIQIPILLMGYLNPVLQFGIEKFLKLAHEVGIDGCIIPDLPLKEYRERYLPLFQKYKLDFVPLLTPTTPQKRYSEILESASSFVYAVSSTGVTGGSLNSKRREEYFQKLEEIQQERPVMVGFGISSKEEFDGATANTSGAIIGSAFLKAIDKDDTVNSGRVFLKGLLSPQI